MSLILRFAHYVLLMICMHALWHVWHDMLICMHLYKNKCLHSRTCRSY